jgi:alcohol/geraniol dehydrogenase (NADP+)
MSNTVKALAAEKAGGLLAPFSYELPEIAAEQVEIAIEHCGICHSDLSMLNNEWGITTFPFVPGHEIVGRVTALGSVAATKNLQIGQKIGIGWNASCCQHCAACISGEQHLCATSQPTIVGNHGGFANKIRVNWLWAIPIPEDLAFAEVGPLLCGGITVFSPLLQQNVRPTDHVGVFGIGGLGHMALKFLKAWGCEVTAFTSSDSKTEALKGFGATHVASSTEMKGNASLRGKFNLIIVTSNVKLDWNYIISLLANNGKLHFVGAVTEPIPVSVFALMSSKKSIHSSPTGSRAEIDKMLQFAEKHNILPQTEHFPMSKANEAMEHLHQGKANYRIVLDMDL